MSPGYTAVVAEYMVKATVLRTRTAPYTEENPKHGKNSGLGAKMVVFDELILLDQEDAEIL
ncbi:MAG: hypothetical protein M1837_006581 [Sclerophora amabilis]|nr:MAG: hypothetical protein M1837_006581 [Sclerophora amabilis]